MYLSPMTSTDPGNALYYVFCQNEYWETFTGKLRHPFVTRQVQNFQRDNFSEQSVLHLNVIGFSMWVFFFSPLKVSLYPKLVWDDILHQYQSIRSANQTIKRAPLFSNKAFWACVLHFKQSKHQEVVWTKNQCMVVKCFNWKNVHLSNNWRKSL